MKRLFVAAAIALASTSALADSLSISVGQPGFYGQIQLGDAPPPQLIYAQPVVVQPPPVNVVAPPPVYMHVPPGYERHWARYCHQYGACGRPVYFVHDDWYNKVYVPHYREHGGHWEDRHDHGDHWDHHDDHDHGHGDHDHGDRGDRDWGR